MAQFLKVLWSISDLIILFGLFYGTILIFKLALPLQDLAMISVVVGTIVVNIVAPYIGTYFETPLFVLVDKFGLSYYQPITILSGAIAIIAFVVNSGKFKFKK